MKQYTFRMSDFSNFYYNPTIFVKRYLDKNSNIPNPAMLFGTQEHKKKELLNGSTGEVEIKLPLDEHIIVGHIDYYNGKEIKDYKFTQKIERFEGYKFQIAFYQYLVWRKDGVLVPATLEMNEVDYNPFADVEYTTTGKILEHKFKKPSKENLLKFEKKISSAIKQMIYLVEKPSKPIRPKSEYTKEQLKEMSADLPEEMRTIKTVRYGAK